MGPVSSVWAPPCAIFLPSSLHCGWDPGAIRGGACRRQSPQGHKALSGQTPGDLDLQAKNLLLDPFKRQLGLVVRP